MRMIYSVMVSEGRGPVAAYTNRDDAEDAAKAPGMYVAAVWLSECREATASAAIADACEARGYTMVACEIHGGSAVVLARRDRHNQREYVVWSVSKLGDCPDSPDIHSGQYSGYVARGADAAERTRKVFQARCDTLWNAFKED